MRHLTSHCLWPALAASLLWSLPASAEVRKSCYKRDYSEAHLKAHPNQHVQSLRIKLVEVSETKTATAYVSGRYSDQGRAKRDKLRGESFMQSAFCLDAEAGKRFSCHVECDGGSFKILSRSAEGMEIETAYFALADSDGCEAKSDLAELGGGKTVYRLTAAPETDCPPN